jgi:hypothetical protein
MKKTMVLAAIGIVLFSACSKIKQLANINVDIPYSQQFSVPQVAGDTQGVALPAGGISLSFPAVGFATNSQQYISQYNTAVSLITDVDLKSLELQILSPATQNFNFIDSVQIYISAPSQPLVLVAYEYNLPQGSTSLNLTTLTSVNLKNYFVQDSIYFTLVTRLNAIPATGTQMNMAAQLNLLANPLN